MSHKPRQYFKDFWTGQAYFRSYKVQDSLSWDELACVASTMNIRTSGTRLERRLILANPPWCKVVGKQNHGDAWIDSSRTQAVEIKTSFITPNKNSTSSFRGVRLWVREVVAHYFVLIDIRDMERGPMTKIFRLDREQLLKEFELGVFRVTNKKKKDRNTEQERDPDSKTERGVYLTPADLKRWEQYEDKLIKKDLDIPQTEKKAA